MITRFIISFYKKNKQKSTKNLYNNTKIEKI